MNLKQFEALSILSRLRHGPAREAARLMLVEGESTSNAARLAGCSIQSASNTYQRCLTGLRLIRQVLGEDHED